MSLKEYIFGFSSEDLAVDYLKKLGFKIICRNFHSKFGEIDIIAKKDDVYHFIEVKSTSKDYETVYRVTKKKIYKIIKTINFYMLKFNINSDYQIDLICVEKGEFKFLENISF
ncbi:YraN family protein [Campylobacter hyointestinalis]|uniref:YraN family protein n=1 Tax=Campylobacter hyointestinalis TaxID=198 RepID=UPI000DCEB9D6|nr:YraN family protein [Campylobacter hyointestinalis]RAZ45775.1 YraN family protein [Campylobacter hyointestinalis subsp. lawsonii]